MITLRRLTIKLALYVVVPIAVGLIANYAPAVLVAIALTMLCCTCLAVRVIHSIRDD